MPILQALFIQREYNLQYNLIQNSKTPKLQVSIYSNLDSDVGLHGWISTTEHSLNRDKSPQDPGKAAVSCQARHSAGPAILASSKFPPGAPHGGHRPWLRLQWDPQNLRQRVVTKARFCGSQNLQDLIFTIALTSAARLISFILYRFPPD